MGGSLGPAVSAPRWHIVDTPAARQAVSAVRTAKSNGHKARPGQVGITRWIKDVSRGGVPFSANRAATARGSRGLTLGRQTDHMLRDWVERRPLGKGQARKYLDSVATALQKHKLMPVAVQLQCGLPQIKTEVDLVCVKANEKRAGIVFVELKTTRQTLQQAASTYSVPCLRLPRMRHPEGHPNTEENAHKLQAAFGARAALATHPELRRFPTSAAVLLVSLTGSRFYTVDPPDKAIFDVPHSEPARVWKDRPKPFRTLPTVTAGGGLIRAALKAAGHNEIRPGGAASATSTIHGHKCTVAIEPKWAKMTTAERRTVRQRATALAVKEKAKMVALVAREGARKPWRCATWQAV